MSLFSTRLPTIKTRISVLVVACILPATLAATLLLSREFVMERTNIELGAVYTARALNQAIDRELIGAKATLKVLSSSPYLQTGDLENFYVQTQEILHDVDGAILVLSDANGQELINTQKPYGSALPAYGNPSRFGRIVRSAQAVISDLIVGENGQLPLVAVELAVRRDGQIAYVLSIGFHPARIGGILERQHLPKDQIVSILDSTGAVIASAPASEQIIGSKINPGLLNHMRMHEEGTLDDAPNGIPVMLTFNRSTVSNWTLVISTPRSTIANALWESVSLIVGGTLLLLAVGLTLAHIIGGQISKAIKGLVQPALALGHGNAVIIPALRLQEADDVGHALIKAAKLIQLRTVERDMAKQAAQHIHAVKQKFEYHAYHDALTGLANRMLFNELISSGIKACASNEESLIVFYIDLDDFKIVNDRYGHSIGDELLRLFAGRLKAGLRESDITARLGGDEFAAILMRTNLNHAESTAEALVDTLSLPYLIGDLTVTTSASIGIAGFPDSGSNPETLLMQADMAMYRAKTHGKRRCAVFDKALDTPSAA